MKHIYLIFVLFLAGCGAMGVGKNEQISIYNSSESMINVSGDRGVYKINPNSSTVVFSKSFLQINSYNNLCNTTVVPTETNTKAIVLDIIPGVLLGGVIPLIVDSVSDGMETLPEHYTYTCNQNTTLQDSYKQPEHNCIGGLCAVAEE